MKLSKVWKNRWSEVFGTYSIFWGMMQCFLTNIIPSTICIFPRLSERPYSGLFIIVCPFQYNGFTRKPTYVHIQRITAYHPLTQESKCEIWRGFYRGYSRSVSVVNVGISRYREKVEIRLIRRHCKERHYFAVYSMVRYHFVHRRTGCNVMFKHHSKEAGLRWDKTDKNMCGERNTMCSWQTVRFPRSVRSKIPSNAICNYMGVSFLSRSDSVCVYHFF